MADLFRFRCPDCGKLLGVAARKVGRPVACPRCGAELIVPELAAADPAPGDEPDDFAGLGIDLGIAPTLDLRPSADRTAPRREPRGDDLAEAVGFLERIASEPPARPEAASAGPAGEGGDLDGPSAEGPSRDDQDDEPEPLVSAPVEALVPRRRRARGGGFPAVDRRRDVVLPRTAAVAWALFAIFALGLAFVAGLMIGHYRWR